MCFFAGKAAGHFHIQSEVKHVLDREHSIVRAPGSLLSSWSSESPEQLDKPKQRVLVKFALCDWFSVGANCQSVRVIQSLVYIHGDSGSIIVDTASLGTTEVGDVQLCNDEVLHIAESSAGGHQGWHQASYSVHRTHAPTRTRFMLDRAPECAQGSRI